MRRYELTQTTGSGHAMVTAPVQPPARTKLNARMRPSTILLLKRDMTTPRCSYYDPDYRVVIVPQSNGGHRRYFVG